MLVHPGRIDLASLLTGLSALAILVVLAQTRLAVVSALIALLIPTVVVVLAGTQSVARVGDQGDIPQGVPLPISQISGSCRSAWSRARWRSRPSSWSKAQGSPKPRQTPPVRSRIRIRTSSRKGQATLRRGSSGASPVGGSVGRTALNVTVGGRTRWAAIWSGIWMLLILAIFSGLVAKIAVPTLAAILIFAAIGSLRLGEVASILRTGHISQVAVITTFAATLFLPVAAAVGIGVALSLLLQLNQEAMDLTVVELVPRDDGRFEERPPPPTLTSRHVTILDVYGSLLYAGSRTLAAHLPDPAGLSLRSWCCG